MTILTAPDEQPREYLYRYREVVYAALVDEFDNIIGKNKVDVTLDRYVIDKRTPCGAWIYTDDGKRFVRLTAIKKFACETVEQAKQSFMARKRRQLKILNSRIDVVIRAIDALKKKTDTHD